MDLGTLSGIVLEAARAGRVAASILVNGREYLAYYRAERPALFECSVNAALSAVILVSRTRR